MTSRAPSNAPAPAVRRALAGLILAASIALAYLPGCRLLAEYHLLCADSLMKKKYYGLAAARLRRAVVYQPGDSRIHQQAGEVYLELAAMARTRDRIQSALAAALKHFRRAARENPHRAEVYYRLGRTIARLENDPSHTTPPPRTGPDLPARYYFQEAVRLRPNGVLYNYALLQDLARHGETAAMAPLVRTLVANYPPVYAGLKQEPFWSPALESACIEGLHQAVANRISPRRACHYLSELAAKQSRWTQALALYRKGLEIEPETITAHQYLHLGRLHLEAGDLTGAAEEFINGLSVSGRPEATLAQIYRIYKSARVDEGFGLFFTDVRDRFFFSYTADLLYARYLVEAKQYGRARDLLTRINREKPRAEAYYWLARIAQAEQDWDRMELAIQKATLYDPRNPHYRRVFAGVLKRQKKMERAKREMELVEALKRK